jgi:hypothetical protein
LTWRSGKTFLYLLVVRRPEDTFILHQFLEDVKTIFPLGFCPDPRSVGRSTPPLEEIDFRFSPFGLFNLAY